MAGFLNLSPKSIKSIKNLADLSKILGMRHVQDSCVNQHDFNECMIYHRQVHIVSYHLSQKKFQNLRFLYGTFWTQIETTSHCVKGERVHTIMKLGLFRAL